MANLITEPANNRNGVIWVSDMVLGAIFAACALIYLIYCLMKAEEL